MTTVAKLTAALAALALAGCETAAVGLKPPAPALMKVPAKADDLPVKTTMKDLYSAYIKLKSRYGRETAKVRGLQAYARTVTR